MDNQEIIDQWQVDRTAALIEQNKQLRLTVLSSALMNQRLHDDLNRSDDRTVEAWQLLMERVG